MKETELDQRESSKEVSKFSLCENLLYLQLSLLVCSALVVLLLISPKSSFMAIYSAILLIAAPLISTSIVITASTKSKLKEIEHLILTSGISIVGSFFCGVFLVKANFMPPNYLVLDFFPSFYYYLISFLLFFLGIFSFAVFIKNIATWVKQKEELQEEDE
ncbi:MAG: hypothetical protein ACTSYA_07610 [Candidatus Kariarchaeaceae archaeon]